VLVARALLAPLTEARRATSSKERSMIGFRSRQVCSLAVAVAVVTTCVGVTSSFASVSARAETNCRIVVAGAPWKVVSRSGSSYTLVARDMPCAKARPWVVKITQQTSKGVGTTFKGPSGFACRSFATSTSGDKLVYSGTCSKGPHNVPFFGWGPKVH
jgi:hypothetical protein